ncbi:hypothetical protein BD560DRAFT_430166 [Blakeslea trispora]|nr:hypothetical protein BD560DRAFT_430166 [Blakeslea trispora]
MTIPTQSPSNTSANQDTMSDTEASTTVLPPISAGPEGLDHMEIDDHPGKRTDSLGTAIEILLAKRDLLTNMVIKGTDGDDVDALDFDAWLRNDLLLCGSWEAAKAAFVKTFGSSLLRLESRSAIMTMRIRGNETVSEYGLRFGRAVADAGYDRMDSILGDVFLCGFPESWQVQINTVLASIHHGETAWSFQDIAAAVQSVFGDRRPGGAFGAGTSSSRWAPSEASGSGSGSGSVAGPSKRRRTGDGGRSSGRSGSSGRSSSSGSGRRFFCSKHAIRRIGVLKILE